MRAKMPRFVAVLAMLGVGLCTASPANAGQFLDLTSVTPGTSGIFAGTLGGVSVTGAITKPTANFEIEVIGTMYSESVINNTSPQYSYKSIYTPSTPLTDQVGYASLANTLNNATITIHFGSAITDPVFQVANLDAMHYDFSPTTGLKGLSLLSGNGGGGDGILVSGKVIADADSRTVVPQDPTVPPPTTPTPRSAYGSVELLGTFTSLTIDVSNSAHDGGDGGSFTLSLLAVPEPSTLVLAVTGGIFGLAYAGGCRMARAVLRSR
jgi:hypothetical protein